MVSLQTIKKFSEVLIKLFTAFSMITYKVRKSNLMDLINFNDIIIYRIFYEFLLKEKKMIRFIIHHMIC